MGTILIAVLAVALIAAACFVTYRTAEVHELHKMRAAFEKKERSLEDFLHHAPEDKIEEIKGEIEGLKEAIELLQEEEASI